MSYLKNRRETFHLSKTERVPVCYKEAEKILISVKSCKGNVKTILGNSRLRGSIFKKVYALSMNVLKHRHFLEKILEETQLLEKEPFLRKDLAIILIYELIFGKEPPSGSKPVDAVLKHRQDIEDAYSKISKKDIIDLSGFPKYVRINTLLTSIQDVLKNLKEEGYQIMEYDRNLTENEFYNLLKELNTGSFLIDYHFKDLLVFSGRENLTSWKLYQEGHIFIQDKSSYIPVHALDPKPGSVVLDACAAPGMKTSHIAARMKNKGILFAFEMDKSRFQTLKSITEKGNVKICTAACKDFSSIDPNDPKFSNVEYILLDPSCSGSGIVHRMDDVTDTEDSKNDFRIEKLARFQISLLKHALLFPNVKRVVYSTCSVNEKENEYVVHEALNHFKYDFKLCEVLPQWSIRGFDSYEFGNLCLRSCPDKNFANGFFVAMFERI